MYNFPAQSLFDISQFAHNQIFNECEGVWEVLSKIGGYLSKVKLGNIAGEVDPKAYLINPEQITIGRGTVVEAGAYIHGPCIIGEDCEVRFGAYIRGNLITGNKCVVGHATEVKNALFLDGAKAGHFAYIGDSILGNRVNLGAGVKCANFRLDGKNISLFSHGEKIETHLRKFGAILGDDVHIGCNAVLNPGTIMGKKSGAHPCLSIRGIIAENQIVKMEEAQRVL